MLLRFAVLLVCALASTAFAQPPPASADATPTERVPDVVFVPTPMPVVDLMLLLADVKKEDVVYDLGCGDGRLVIRAAKMRGARGIGIDIDPKRVAEAKRWAAAAKVEELVQFRQDDIFTSDFHDATVLMLYLLDDLNERLRPMIFAQVKPGTRVVSHAFRMGEWEPEIERTLKLQGVSYNVFFWVVPANVSGRWKVRAPQKREGVPSSLVLEQTFQMITARDADNSEVLGQGRVTGNEFVLILNTATPGKTTTFRGSIAGDKLTAAPSGKRETWEAEREPGSAKAIEPQR